MASARFPQPRHSALCAVCSSPRSVGVLCAQHSISITSPWVTSEQIYSNAKSGTASLIDAWGCSHLVSPGSRIGRDSSLEVVVLHSSVSRLHAAFELRANIWWITDRSSRNGIEVDGHRLVNGCLDRGSILRMGDVALYFWPDVFPKTELRGAGDTGPARRVELAVGVSAVTSRGQRFDLSERGGGGLLRLGSSAVQLAPMEFALLQLLIEGRRTQDVQHGWVSWSEISRGVCFDSISAESDNVRELVHRVRRKLEVAGAFGLIESKRGVGYRFTGTLAE